MKWKSFVVAWALALTLLLFAQRHSTNPDRQLYASVIDLSHSVPDAVTQTSIAKSNSTPGRSIVFDQPVATRLDAPSQLIAGMWSVDQIPSERLVRPMVVIDIHNKVRDNSDYRLSMQDIADFEQVHGHIPGGAVVMAATGWDDRWNSLDRYRNLSSDGTPHFPGFTLEAAKFLVEARGIVGLGIDSPSTDGGNSTNFSIHRYCAERSVYHLENVANLVRVPQTGAVAVVTPLKIEKGTGAPVRLLALLK